MMRCCIEPQFIAAVTTRDDLPKVRLRATNPIRMAAINLGAVWAMLCSTSVRIDCSASVSELSELISFS
jgi:hypothetical protein